MCSILVALFGMIRIIYYLFTFWFPLSSRKMKSEKCETRINEMLYTHTYIHTHLYIERVLFVLCRGSVPLLISVWMIYPLM